MGPGRNLGRHVITQSGAWVRPILPGLSESAGSRVVAASDLERRPCGRIEADLDFSLPGLHWIALFAVAFYALSWACLAWIRR